MKPESCFTVLCPCRNMGSDFTRIEIGKSYERSRLMFCGEASGEAEAREGLPFRPYAQAGSLLTDCMREAQVSREEVAITNVLRCRPKNDWLEGAPYAAAAIQNCINNNLFAAIEQLKPRAILAIGGTAFRALCAVPRGKYAALDYCRGYVHMGQGAATGIPVIPTYHSSFLRRGNPHLTPLLTRDIRRSFLLATGRLIEGKHFSTKVENLGLRYQTSPTIDEAWAFAEGIDPNLPIAWDCETPRSRKEDEEERVGFAHREIELVQFTQKRGEGIALPYRDEFIDVVKHILATPNRKLTHNGWNFDDEVAEANGIPINGERIDVMCAYGFYWSDLPKNLQSAAQMAGFPFPWKHLGESDKEFYGVADVDSLLCEYHYIHDLLQQEGSWDSFMRYFAQLYPVLRDMSRRGIPISEEKRMELKSLITEEDQRVTREIQGVVPEGVRGTKQKNGLKRNPLLECPYCHEEFRTDHECEKRVG